MGLKTVFTETQKPQLLKRFLNPHPHSMPWSKNGKRKGSRFLALDVQISDGRGRQFYGYGERMHWV